MPDVIGRAERWMNRLRSNTRAAKAMSVKCWMWQARPARTVRKLKWPCEFHRDSTVTALYGFSGGGYNVLHIIKAVAPAERARLRLVVVLGAPHNPSHLYKGPWDLVYRTDPPGGHMDGSRALLATLH
jgi:hypothetical protein